MIKKFAVFVTAAAIMLTSVNLFAFDAGIITEGNNKFAVELYARLKNENGNIFFSPFSISTALAMVYAGARGNTEAQMAGALHFGLNQESLHSAFLGLTRSLNSESSKNQYQLEIANALWGQSGYDFRPEFMNITKNYYEAGFKEVDFIKNTEPARQTINKWVEEKTNDRIKDLIVPGVLTSITRLVLTNAIYFKGKWSERFKKEFTAPEKFELVTGEKVEVPMMSQTEKFGYFENETVQVLELPYEGNRLSMVIFLPKAGKSIKDLESLFTAENIKAWASRLYKEEVIISLPKFKMTSEFYLNEALESLGITDAFNPKLSDLSGITADPRGLRISEVIHKAFVEVSEEGTEAAAATAIILEMATSIAEPTPVFKADHPFIFIIRDKPSDSILFIGRVTNPS